MAGDNENALMNKRLGCNSGNELAKLFVYGVRALKTIYGFIKCSNFLQFLELLLNPIRFRNTIVIT